MSCETCKRLPHHGAAGGRAHLGLGGSTAGRLLQAAALVLQVLDVLLRLRKPPHQAAAGVRLQVGRVHPVGGCAGGCQGMRGSLLVEL